MLRRVTFIRIEGREFQEFLHRPIEERLVDPQKQFSESCLLFRVDNLNVYRPTSIFCFSEKKNSKTKGTPSLSPILKGTCHQDLLIFVITVLIIQLVTLFHAQNIAFTAKGRYQVNFRIDTKLYITGFK